MRPSCPRSLATWVLLTFAASAFESTQAAGQSTTYYLERGLDRLNRRQFDRAIADYNEAIRLDPKSAVTHQLRGSAWAAKGDQEKAGADDRQAELLKKQPERLN